MNHHLTLALANQRVAEMHATAAQAQRARIAAADGDGPAARRGRLSRLLARRRYHRVELVWPDGVCSVVSVSRPSASADDSARGMAGTKR